MPSVALHSHYWQTQAPEVPILPGASGSGGYVTWQITTITAMGFILFAVVPLGG